MLLNTAPQNEAIISNVGEIGEFRIRNSAKAFNILSSGLYANKIKAIIRELSTNAYDSHAAAGKLDTPFDVHLPNSLEPWFSIRDYGTGLNHEQVTNIYTTYFESTKTNSNEFVGCLGLGSKSPFSYTENFTVTAIKDGVKRIYTAFINDHGVPSIAAMTVEDTTEPSGVEVRFAVEDYYDCRKFEQEARNVYRYFKLRPVISGASVTIDEVQFIDENIIPGVHTMKNHGRSSVAIMGNIAYPIDVPNASTNLGSLEQMLNCGLMLEFSIGELDFQACRDGLSYIPQTIKAIKDKLEALQSVLTDKLSVEANAYTCLWARADFLMKKREQSLWYSAVEKYVADNNFPLIGNKPGTWEHMRLARLEFEDTVLASTYNLVIRGFTKSRSVSSITNVKPDRDSVKNAQGTYEYRNYWRITPSLNVVFVKNDTKIGATERAKYHWRNTNDSTHSQSVVYVLDAADKEKPALFDAFLKAIHNPPNHVFADTLKKKERAVSDRVRGESVSILNLVEDGRSYRTSYVWRDAGKASDFDAKSVFYYLPLSGYAVESKYGYSDAKELKELLTDCGISSLGSIHIYGVRKSDIEYIKLQKNWVNLEDHIHKTLSSLTTEQLASLANNRIDKPKFLQYTTKIVSHVSDANSPFVKLARMMKDIDHSSYEERYLKKLFSIYAKDCKLDLDKQAETMNREIEKVSKKYPLLRNIEYYRIDVADVAHYINIVDTQSKE